MSKSIKEKPENCHILTADYSFNELLTIVENEYKVGKSQIASLIEL